MYMIDYFWLMDNLEWFVFILVITTIILFFFQLILGYDLKNEIENENNKDLKSDEK